MFKKTGIRVETGAKVENVHEAPRRRAASPRRWPTGKTRRSKPRSCWSPSAASRTPRTSASKAHSVELDRGFIKVDGFQRTGEPGVYAIGDIVAGTPQLAHVATDGGHGRGRAHRRQAGRPDQPEPHSRRHLHRARHRQRRPDRGAGARRRATRSRSASSPSPANSKATILGSHDGFVKVVADAKYGEILGVHIIGPQASELIARSRGGDGSRSHRRDA